MQIKSFDKISFGVTPRVMAVKKTGNKVLRTSDILLHGSLGDVKEVLKATQRKLNAEVAEYSRSLRRGTTPKPMNNKAINLIVASCKYLGNIPKAKK